MSKYVIFLHSVAGHPLPLNPIGTIFPSNWIWHYEYTRMCLDSRGSLCVQFGRASSSQWLPKPCSGGFAWENSMSWPTSPTTWSFHSIFFAMIFVCYKDCIPPKIMWFGMVCGLLCRFCGEKWGSRCGQLDVCAGTGNIHAQLLSAQYLWVLSLIVVSPGHRTHFTFRNHPCLVPQMTTSGKALKCAKQLTMEKCAEHWIWQSEEVLHVS